MSPLDSIATAPTLHSSPVMPVDLIDDDEPPGKSRRLPVWDYVPPEQWNDWKWQSQNAVRSVRQLRDLLDIPPEELQSLGELEREYKTSIPPVGSFLKRTGKSIRL